MGREYNDSPPLETRQEEDEETFLKRKNLVEEDRYIGRKRVDGLPEYSHFDTTEIEEELGDNEKIQNVVNRLVFRFCVLRIFRPELAEDFIKTFIELFLDSSYTQI